MYYLMLNNLCLYGQARNQLNAFWILILLKGFSELLRHLNVL
jgi:hypothetical protein